MNLFIYFYVYLTTSYNFLTMMGINYLKSSLTTTIYSTTLLN